MKSVILIVALLGLAAAKPQGYNYPKPQPPSTSYGLPNYEHGSSGHTGGSFQQGHTGGSFQQGHTGGSFQQTGGNVYRHVYVHAAPDESLDEQSRVIRIPSNPNKHVNIIFVKTPSSSANQQTEVILPEQEQQKTIVYVLHRKFDASTDLKIRAPRPQQPAKPQVYFIKYKDAASSSQSSSSSSSSAGTFPSGEYGAPY